MNILRFLVVSLMMALPGVLPALGQCVPVLEGAPTGPHRAQSGTSPVVNAMLAGADGSLVVGGTFVIPPMRAQFPYQDYAARYEGGRWSAMGPGLTQPVRDLAEIDFSGAGGPGRAVYGAAQGGSVLRWTGTAWVEAGSGSGGITALLASADAQGPVLLGASTVGVRAWRGSGAWGMYTSLAGAVVRLRVLDAGDGPALYAAGSFDDSVSGVRYLARLVDGAWAQVGLPPGGAISAITDVTVFDDGERGPEMYVAGVFELAGGAMGNAARLRDGAWEAMGGGVRLGSGGIAPVWLRVEEAGGARLYLGGSLDEPGQYAGLREWRSTGWVKPTFLFGPQGSPAAAACAARFDDGEGAATYFGGTMFESRGVYGATLEKVVTQGMLRLKDGVVESLARGLNDAASAPTVALEVFEKDGRRSLLAAGAFTSAGGRFAYGGARFDGAGWAAMSYPLYPFSGVPVAPAAVRGVDEDRLYSNFLDSSGRAVREWNGAQWALLDAFPPQRNFPVMIGFEGLLYGGGNGLYRLDGAVWTPVVLGYNVQSAVVGNLGGGERLHIGASGPDGNGVYAVGSAGAVRIGGVLPARPTALLIHDEGDGPRLYACGSMPGGIRVLRDGVWEMLGAGLSPESATYGLASFDDGDGPALYVSGGFDYAGADRTPGFARWRAGAWSSVAPWVQTVGLPGLPQSSLAVLGDRLYVAGAFTSIGPVQADHFAWLEACPRSCSRDYDGDGDVGTDADIEAFFRCLAGECCVRCTADFDGDGEPGADADIEAFFRVLAGGNC